MENPFKKTLGQEKFEQDAEAAREAALHNERLAKERLAKARKSGPRNEIDLAEDLKKITNPAERKAE